MPIGQYDNEVTIEVISDTRHESKLNGCCLNRQRLHNIITGVCFGYFNFGKQNYITLYVKLNKVIQVFHIRFL